MKALRLDGVRKVLCLGAHSDDLEIGAGGTVLTLIGQRTDLDVHWVVFSARAERGAEARSGAAAFLSGCAKQTIELHEFRDGFFPYSGVEIKETFERLKSAVRPDLILTHHRQDLHQDHRMVAELTWNTFRDHVILEYEIPKYDGDLASPNVFVELAESVGRRKIEILMSVFASQRAKRWFSPQNFEAILRLRGVESNATSGLAEGFHAAKLVVSG